MSSPATPQSIMTPTQIKAALAEIGVHPSKGRGQNFLFDVAAVTDALRFARVTSDENVIEVGPGLGVLSAPLAAAAKRYCAIEVEERFCARLSQQFVDAPACEVVCEDVRRVDLAADERFKAERWVVVSNVPYSISTEVILWILENRSHISRACLLLQREFAERVAAEPGTREASALTLHCALYADVRLGRTVSGSCFFPSADVESALLEFRLLAAPRVAVNEQLYEQVVRAAFGQRRKTLANSLSGAVTLGEKERVAEALASAGIDAKRRAETLTVAEFCRLTDAFERA